MTAIRLSVQQADRQDAQPRVQPFFGAISQSARLTCLFGSFVFLQFTVLGLANHAGEGYLTQGERDTVYYALQVFVILGFLLRSLFSRVRIGKRTRSAAGYAVCGLFFACAAWMLAAGTDSILNVIASMTAALCLGGIGGAAHYRMSLETVAGAKTARCMGLGSAAAVVLQYLLQIRQGVTPLLPVFMGTAFFLLLFMLADRNPKAAAAEAEQPEKTTTRRLVSAILIASAFLLFVCFYNETIHHLQIRSGYESANVYSWPRLMLVPGYLLFAVIGDRKNGKYVPVASLCIMLVALLNVILIGNAGAYWLNMCFFYFAIAGHTSYYLLTFWRLAPGTARPAFWAPFGRMLDSAMVLFTGAIHLSRLPAPVVLGVDIAGLVLVILLMAINGDFNLSATIPVAPTNSENHVPSEPEDTAPMPELLPLLSPEETLDRIRERYSLTRRETEVLRELVLTEDKQTVVSERLSIQVKTLQDYVTRLYRKTGASTRAGLTELYHESRQWP